MTRSSYSRHTALRHDVLLLAVLVLAVLVVTMRVYGSYDRVRVRPITTERLANDGQISIRLPDMSDLAGQVTAVIVRVSNRSPSPLTLSMSVDRVRVYEATVPAEASTRLDFPLSVVPALAEGQQVLIEGDHEEWSVHELEFANIHGFSHGIFSLVVVPKATSFTGAGFSFCLLFVVLCLGIAWSQLNRPPTGGLWFAQTALRLVASVVLAVVVVAPWVSPFKVLLARQAALLCLLLVFPAASTRALQLIIRGTVAVATWSVYRAWPMLAHASRTGWRPWLYGASLALFLWSLAGFYEPATGFTRLIKFGRPFDAGAIGALRDVPHFVDAEPGYDGQFYAQLALDPLVRDPDIQQALDNFSYRARRILFSWTAYLAGLGHPSWVLEAYAVQNIVCWLALALILLRWLPPASCRHFVCWFACLFCHGLVFSVTSALLDGPSMLLLAVAIIATETGRSWLAAVIGGLAGLGRETNLLFAAVLPSPPSPPWSRKWLLGKAGRLALLVLPLGLWLYYLHVNSPASVLDSGNATNFGWPFAAYLAKWQHAVTELGRDGWTSPFRFELLTLVSVTIQAAFLITVWHWRSPWWRVGVAYAGLSLVVGQAVWMGVDSAVPRLVLPMTFAFNIALASSPTRLFWLLFVLGNLTVWQGLFELRVPWLWRWI